MKKKLAVIILGIASAGLLAAQGGGGGAGGAGGAGGPAGARRRKPNARHYATRYYTAWSDRNTGQFVDDGNESEQRIAVVQVADDQKQEEPEQQQHDR